MKTNWISTENKLPPFETLVWLWDGDDYITLGVRICIYDNDDYFHVYGRLDGDIYIENYQITAECEMDDLNVKYWHKIPQLKL